MRIRRVLAIPAFARYWTGDTVVRVVDQLSQIAILWYLAMHGHSAQKLGWYVFWTMAPVILGGPMVEALFRRFSVRAVMVSDLSVRALAYGFLAAAVFGWHSPGVPWRDFDTFAVVNALVFMATVAGGPNLWSRLVPAEQTDGAVAAEQVGWNAAGLAGPLLAGLLAVRLGMWAVLGLASTLLVLAAVNLMRVPLTGEEDVPAPAEASEGGGRRVWAVVRSHSDVAISTGLFWFINLTQGFLWVLWPLIASQFWHGSGVLYGAMVTTEGAGALLGSLVVPSWLASVPLLTRILAAEAVAGTFMILSVPGLNHPWWTFVALFMSAFLGAAPATWALQARFDATTTVERPAVMTYIRTFLHTAGPIGSLLAGWVWTSAGAAELLLAAVAVQTVPAAVLLAHRLLSRRSLGRGGK